jgi:hypothetical protein
MRGRQHEIARVLIYHNLDHGWLIKSVEHRVADPRILRLIQKWLKSDRGRQVVESEDRESARLGDFTAPREYLAELHFRSLGERLAQEVCARRGGGHPFCG